MDNFAIPTLAELGSWQLWHRLCQLRLAEEASASLEISPAEINEAWSEFCRRQDIDPAKGLPVPRVFFPCGPDELRSAVARDLRISRWQKATFGPHAKEHFERRKPTLDRVVYSLIRVKDGGLARELWFRLKENEATFADLALRYTSGHELHTLGIVGPSAFGSMHPALAAHLRAGEEGKLLKPALIGNNFVVARVEKFLPAQYDEKMEGRMIEELCSQWLNAKLDESRA